MTATATNIKAAKRFTTNLVSNMKLLNAFIATERKIIQINPKFETASLDNFLVRNHYNCTLDQVMQYGKPTLSELNHWAGTYYTQTKPKDGTDWSTGPVITISEDGTLSIADVRVSEIKFDFLNLTWEGNSVLFYMAKNPDGGKRIPGMFGTYSGFRIVGLSKQPRHKKASSKHESTFERVFGIINKTLNQINNAFQMYDLIKRASGKQKKVDDGDLSAENDLGDTQQQLGDKIADTTQSQGEVVTEQQQAIESSANNMGGDFNKTPEELDQEASEEVRDLQSDEFDLEQVSDVDAAQLNPGGDEILQAGAEDGGLDFASEGMGMGEDAAGELTLDMFGADDLLVLLLL